jgi:hypothetical protein
MIGSASIANFATSVGDLTTIQVDAPTPGTHHIGHDIHAGLKRTHTPLDFELSADVRCPRCLVRQANSAKPSPCCTNKVFKGKSFLEFEKRRPVEIDADARSTMRRLIHAFSMK